MKPSPKLSRLLPPLLLLLCLLLTMLTACFAAPATETETETETETATEFSFIFFSDVQAQPRDDGYTAADYADYAGLLSQARQATADAPAPSLLLLGGDTVNDGSDAAEWQALLQAGAGLFDGLTVLAVEGNHDRHGLVYEYFPRPKGARTHRDSFWSYDYGGVHFLLLDSNLMGAAEAEDIAWLEADLAANQQPWTVAVLHHPLWPALAKDKDQRRALTMQENFTALLDKNQVDLLLCGHQHLYMRTAGDSAPPQLMLSSGGKQYAAAEAAPDYALLLSERAPAYLLCRVQADGLYCRVQDETGLIDEFVISKQD